MVRSPSTESNLNLTPDELERRELAIKALRNGDFDFALKAVQLGDASIPEMVEDLKIYQAELEIQNDELRESQLLTEQAMRRFSQFFAALPLPALVVDEAGVVQECNDSAEGQFALQVNHLRSHFLPRLVQKQEHARLQKFLHQVMDTGQGVLVHVGLQAADKRLFIADLHAAVIPHLHEAAGQLLLTIVDQTQSIAQRSALEASRRHFMAYFASAPVGMAATSPEKGWVEVNDRLCTMLGYTREALQSMTWLELTHSDDLAPDLVQFQRLLNKELDRYDMDKRFIRQDGSILEAHIAVNAVRKADDSLDYCVAILEDIGQRKQAERSLIERDLLLSQQSVQLRERVKELRAIYAISRAAHESNDYQVFFAEVLRLIPPGMQYTDDTQVRIRIQGKEFQTANFRQTMPALRGPIKLDDGSGGDVVVSYDKVHQDLDQGPFFKEEQQFIDGIAELIARFCNRMHTDQQRSQAIERNQALLTLTMEAATMFGSRTVEACPRTG